MKMSIRLLVLAAAAASLMSLTACSKKPGDDLDQGSGAGQSSGQGSQAYGANGNNGGFHVNALTAPSNQTYYFGFDKSDLNPDDMKALTIQSQYIAAHQSANVRLEGNTDNRGSREYNIGLGWRRDQTVARVMEQQGARPKQIQMVSYGKENPAVEGDNSHAWALNRRVNLVYRQEG